MKLNTSLANLKRNHKKKIIRLFFILKIAKTMILSKTYTNLFWVRKIVLFLSQSKKALLEEDIL